MRLERVGIRLIEPRDDGRLVAYLVRGTDQTGRVTPGLSETCPLDDAELPARSPDLSHLLQGYAFYYCPDRWAVTPPAYRCQLEGRMREQLAVAVRHDGKLVGCISMDNLLSRRLIVEGDAAPLVACAAQAALAISRAPALRPLLDGTPTHNLVVPLRSGATVTGMISVDNLVSGRPISPDDAGPLLALANLVGTAVENAQLPSSRSPSRRAWRARRRMAGCGRS